jgi:hypothetical protein
VLDQPQEKPPDAGAHADLPDPPPEVVWPQEKEDMSLHVSESPQEGQM